MAAKHGVKSFRVGNVEVNFTDAPTAPAPQRTSLVARDAFEDHMADPSPLPEDDAHDGIVEEVRATVGGYDRWRNKPSAAQSNPFE